MQKEFNYKNVKKVGLVSRPNSNLDTEIANLESILKKKGVELLLFKESSQRLNLASFELNGLFEMSDFVISLGGDGTLISLCRKAYEYEKAYSTKLNKKCVLTEFSFNQNGMARNFQGVMMSAKSLENDAVSLPLTKEEELNARANLLFTCK